MEGRAGLKKTYMYLHKKNINREDRWKCVDTKIQGKVVVEKKTKDNQFVH